LAYEACLVFSLHPIHSEAVCGVVGRADLLWSSFALLAFIVAFKKTLLWPIEKSSLIIMCATVGILCKEQGIMIIPMVLVLTFINDKTSRTLKAVIINCVKFGPYLALAVYLRLRIMNFQSPTFQEGDNPAGFIESRLLRLVNFHYLYALNGWLLVLPDWLCFDWAMGCISLIKGATDFRILFILAMWTVIVGLLLRRNKLVMSALTFIILPFLPSCNIFVLVGFVIGERNLYFSVLGYSILVAYGYQTLSKTKYKGLSKVLFWTTLAFFSLKSLHRGFEWQTEPGLFKAGLRVCPNNAKIHYNIAKLATDRNPGLAKVHYRKAIQLWPSYEHAMNNLGNILKSNGQFIEAESLFHSALKISPKFPACWMNLGIVQTHLNKLEEAEISYKNALKMKKVYPACHFNLGTLYLKADRSDSAVESFTKALMLDSRHFSSHANLVILLDDLGKFELAEIKAKEALKIFPERHDYYSTWFNLSAV
jgi:Tfp pilus assembly protein PilF